MTGWIGRAIISTTTAADLAPYDATQRQRLFERACARLAAGGDPYFESGNLWGVVTALVHRGRVRPTVSQLETLVGAPASSADGRLPALALVAERCAANGFVDEVTALMAKLVLAQAFDKAGRSARERIEALKGTRLASKPEAGEVWSDAVLAALDEMDDRERAAWLSLFAQGHAADAAHPSAAWVVRTAEIVSSEGLGRGRFLARLASWLPLVGPAKAHVLSDENIRALTTLAWALGGSGESEAAQLAGDLAMACLEKIPQRGAVCAKAGNACIWALGAMSGLHGIGELARLKVGVGYVVAERLIQGALETAAERAGMDIEEAQEASVPTFGLDRDGTRSEAIGEWTVTVTVDAKGVSTVWRHPTHGECAAAPKEARNTAVWKSLKRTIDAIKDRLEVESARLERYYLSGRQLTLEDLQHRVLAHPVAGQVARRVLWTVTDKGTSTHAVARLGVLDGLGGPIHAGPTASATPFHPLGSSAEEVAVWSDFLLQHGIGSPFEQLDREVYAPTAEELDTPNCSRFSGRTVDQRKFAALTRSQHWRFTMQGTFDGPVQIAWFQIPGRKLHAEIEVGGSDDEPVGLFRTVVLGTLSFRAKKDLVKLRDVPAIVYSEIVRQLERMSATSSNAR